MNPMTEVLKTLRRQKRGRSGSSGDGQSQTSEVMGKVEGERESVRPQISVKMQSHATEGKNMSQVLTLIYS